MANKTEFAFCADCGAKSIGRRKVSEPTSYRCRACRLAKPMRAGKSVDLECERCGESYRAYYPEQRFCSRDCLYPNRSKYELVKCPCGAEFKASHHRKTYCTKRCARVYGERKPSKPQQPRVHRWRSMVPWSWCVWCDGPFVNRSNVSNYCGELCRRDAYRARGRCAGKFETTALRESRGVLLKSCPSCMCLFDASRTPIAKWCDECRRETTAWQEDMRYKANLVTIRYLADRDGWVCRIPGCGKPIKLRCHIPGNQWSPSRDHIVPVSVALELGWSWEQIHDPANQRLAHNGCNGRRGARGDSEQLALVG